MPGMEGTPEPALLRARPRQGLRRGRDRRARARRRLARGRRAARWSRSWGRRARASPRCSTCSARSRRRPPGEIALGGERYDGLGDAGLTRLRRDRIGFVFQFFNLLPALTAQENVLLPALIAGPPRRGDPRARRRAARAGRARPPHRPTCRPSSPAASSSGCRSPARCSPSRSWCSPTSRPATSTRAPAPQILELLRDLNDAEGQTLVIVTHDAGAAAIAERVVFLRDGRVADEIAGRRPAGGGRGASSALGAVPADRLVRLVLRTRPAPGARAPRPRAADRRRDRARRRDDPRRPAAGGDDQPDLLRPLRLRLRQDGPGRLRATARTRCTPGPSTGCVRTPGVDDAAGNVLSVFTLVEDGLASRGRRASSSTSPGRTREAEDLTDSQTVAGREPAARPRDRASGELGGGERPGGRRQRPPRDPRRGEAASTSSGLFQFSTGLDFGGEGFAAMPLREARDVMDKPRQARRDQRRRRRAATRRSTRSRGGCAIGSRAGVEVDTPAGEERRGRVPAPGLQRDPLLLRRDGPVRRRLPDLQRVQHERASSAPARSGCCARSAPRAGGSPARSCTRRCVLGLIGAVVGPRRSASCSRWR